MCKLCGHRRCPAACPNAEDGVVGKCKLCGDGILRSDSVVVVDGEMYHAECLVGEDVVRLLRFFGHFADKEG
jgi:hypothetical protein